MTERLTRSRVRVQVRPSHSGGGRWPVALGLCWITATATATAYGQAAPTTGAATDAAPEAAADAAPEAAADAAPEAATDKAVAAPVDSAVEVDERAGGANAAQLAVLARLDGLCDGHRIASTRLLGCIGTRCQDPAERARLISLLDLEPGKTLPVGGLETAWRRLVATRFFQSAEPFCRTAAGDAHVAFKVKGNAFVRSIVISGNHDVYRTDIESRLLIQRGEALNADGVEGQARLRHQREVLETLYQREGYEDARVEIRTEPVGVGLVRVLVEIDEGSQQRIMDRVVKVLGVDKPTMAERGADLICAPIEAGPVLDQSGLGTVDIFAQRHVIKARAKLRRWLRERGYGNPRIEVRHDEAERRLIVEIRPGHCNIVRVLAREEAPSGDPNGGFKDSDDASLLAALPFAETGVYELAEAERGRVALRALFENRGYLFADVQLDHRVVPPGLSRQVERAVTYRITTGYPAQVRGLAFPGAKHFSASTLSGEMDTRAYDFFDEGGYLLTSLLLGDLDTLREFYRDAGFFEFRYALGDSNGGEVLVRQRSVDERGDVLTYRYADKGFRVRRPFGEAYIYVEIPEVEGRRSRVAKLVVEGAAQAGEGRVRGLLGLEPGAVVSFARLLTGLRAVEAWYRENGFFRARIDVQCGTQGPDRAMAVCKDSQILAEHVSLQVRIDEGARVQVGEIFVAGNFDTEAEVILRDMPSGGEVFSGQRLFDLQRRLRNLGIFRSVSFEYIGDKETPVRDRIAIVVRVVEDKVEYVEGALGLQTVNTERSTGALVAPALTDQVEHLSSGTDRVHAGFGRSVAGSLPNLLVTGELAWVDRNFLGQAKEGRLPLKVGWTISQLNPLFLLDEDATVRSSTLEDWLPALATFAPTYVDSRFLGSSYALRVIAPYAVRDFATSTLDVQKSGAFAELSRRFGRLYASTGIDGGFVSWRTEEARAAGEDLEPFRFQVKLAPRLVWDGLDSPLNPTRGLYAVGTIAYINALDPAGSFVNFLKYESTLKGFATLRRTLTFAGLLHVGGILPLTSGEIPLNERFRLGGQHGLRGYTDDGVRQYDASGGTVIACEAGDGCASGISNFTLGDGNVILNGSAELRFPVVRSMELWGATFYDWGGIAQDWQSFHGLSVRHGVGVGLRWLIGGQIPVRFDYGVAIGRRVRDFADVSETVSVKQADGSFSEEEVKTGQVPEVDDFGQFHFSLMYAF